MSPGKVIKRDTLVIIIKILWKVTKQCTYKGNQAKYLRRLSGKILWKVIKKDTLKGNHKQDTLEGNQARYFGR